MSHDRSTVPAMGAHGAGGRPGRCQQRSRPRLSLFRLVEGRPHRRRGRDAHPARRPVAARAPSADAPPAVFFALAADLPEIAAIVLERSPLLIDADLVDRIGGGEAWAQAAIARRRFLPRPVAAALAEVGSAEACLILSESPDAEIPAFSLERLIERLGHLAAVREALLAREDLSAAHRQALVVKLSATLAGLV